MNTELSEIENAIKTRFFSNYDEEQNILNEVLSANSLKKFKITQSKFGVGKITGACELPRPAKIDSRKLFKALHPLFTGDFI